MIQAAVELAKRFPQNPLLKPNAIKPSRPDMTIECLLNPGVFEFESKIWMLMRVAERPQQREGFLSFPLYNASGETEILQFEKTDPDLDLSDPRIIRYQGTEYLTTLSHLRLVCSNDGINFSEPTGFAPIFGKEALESYGIEDCRVTNLDGVYYLTYTMVSPVGVGVGLMETKDWKNFTRHGMIFATS
jgi:beta-1,2-mannobiose phosphorylase / 1,2-beta-oligomannan phosphorylase